MSANKLASSAQGLQSSAIRELLKHSKMAGVISLGGVSLIPICSITKGLKLLPMPSYHSILARRSSTA